jgi:23S rRNA (cytosine1962-C5)-methyltransferase
MDVYGKTAVLELLTEGNEKWKLTHRRRPRRRLLSAPSLDPQECSERDRGVPAQTTTHNSQLTTSPVPFTENGLRFVADVSSGQKTGFYLDQRDNRARLRPLARGRTVLNRFAYSGAFSVAALAGGADRAVDVDSSEPALVLAREHRRANGFPSEEADFVRADVFEDVRRRVQAREQWDIVVATRRPSRRSGETSIGRRARTRTSTASR